MTNDLKKVIIIGAGAAGCFAAIEIKRLRPDVQVTLVEKGKRPLAKVAITGGGRCNLTNSFAQVKSMEHVYPRGHRLMKKLFHHFSHEDAYDWFEKSGIRLTTQEDECVFPQSQDAMEIVNNLLWQIRKSGVQILTETKAEVLQQKEDEFVLITNKGELRGDKVLVATGGHPSATGYEFLSILDIELIPLQPSLFSFCLDNAKLKELMGTVVKEAQVSLPGTKLKAEGALLITHWGISGPAALKLSSYAARILAEKNYVADISIKWLCEDQQDIQEELYELSIRNSDKKVTSVYPQAFNARLWAHLISRSSISPDARWKALNGKDMNRLLNTLTNDTYHMTGKNRFKDEFVTSGGVSLNSLNQKTLEAKNHKGLYFAGEVTDVDAITGGFNLQAAWTMGHVAAQGICKENE